MEKIGKLKRLAQIAVLTGALAGAGGCGEAPAQTQPAINPGEQTVPIVCSSPTVIRDANGGTTIQEHCQLTLPTAAPQGSRNRASS